MEDSIDIHDKQFLRNYFMACHTAETRENLLVDVYPSLVKLLPHKCFACCIGRGTPLYRDWHMNIGFPESYITKFLGNSGWLRSPLVRKWNEERKLVFLKSESVQTLAEETLRPDCFDAFEQYGLRDILFYGTEHFSGKNACYFSFSGLVQWGEEEADLALNVMPHFLYALENIYRISNALHLEVKMPLSTREQEVLKWVSIGKSNAEIATILGISAWTVKIHVTNILAKLNVSNRGHAVANAIKNGFLEIA